jgi:hypothetical protein
MIDQQLSVNNEISTLKTEQRINYWEIFKKHGGIQHGLLIGFGVLSILFFLWESYKSHGISIFTGLYLVLGVVLIFEAFKRLKEKKYLLDNNTSLQNLHPKKSFLNYFLNYFPLILFFINMIIFWILSQKTDLEMGAILVLIYYILVIFTIPLVIISFFGRFKVVNIFTIIFLVSLISFGASFLRF